jgi:hypothetical protein
MIQSAIELQKTLDSTIVQLNSPNIAADVATISSTAHRESTTQDAGQYKYSVTEDGEIHPPEARIHDKLAWDDGKWYRHRSRELSYHIVDFIFWKAKQTGDLTDASDEEISMGTAAAAMLITIALAGDPISILVVGGATSGMTYTGTQAVRKRSERKELEDKFIDDE